MRGANLTYYETNTTLPFSILNNRSNYIYLRCKLANRFNGEDENNSFYIFDLIL
ncbi:hypothetical protein ADIWIN_1991 [Winogradskyella psychrotolerans RS-3]|uniref:Uncharacterized protein n=1 Tax=Winogradskyella psychrotolerans RS-3 TaxID=641526 RepID=S7XA48_9FLAO|nr:hypothetical protein ADIWIN_1991 [Winogradskyella psychrotolerans RS-3]